MVDNVDYSAVVKVLRIWIKRASLLSSSGSTSSLQEIASSSASSALLYSPFIHRKMSYPSSIYSPSISAALCCARSVKSQTTIFWFKDFKPRCQSSNFESFDQLIDKINYAIIEGQINGKILQIETIKCPATEEWTFNSEATYCNDGKTTRDINRYRNTVIVLRVFFKLGELFDDELVLVDFVPKDLSSQTINNKSCERFSSLIDRAALWLCQNTELTYHSAQSVDIEVPGKLG